MSRDLFQYYNHLGFYCPYYYVTNEGLISVLRNFSALVSNSIQVPEIDPVAIAEVLNKRHMLGDRTIIKQISRTPWMAKPNNKYDGWNIYKIPRHLENRENEKSIAKTLFRLLCDEIKGYVGSAKNVGILLSGGMDSRMVVGVVDYLIKHKQIDVTNITAYTWGNPDCRDVVYAERIAKLLNWKWKTYTVTSSDLWENFKIAGQRGCEYSGIHLHAIPQIQKEINDEVLLVGSYGDSIGRAEYSGIHVENLTPINKGFRNFGYLLKHKAYKEIRNHWNSDVDPYHGRFPEIKSYQQRETDYQLHYMRRMLNPCLEILDEVVPTYQAFTSPAIYEYIWSISPVNRNDKIYLNMMDLFPTSLSEIPWARTGLPFGIEQGQPDDYSKHHNSYTDYIQYELIDNIASRIQSDRINALDLFNSEAIKVLINAVKKFPGNNFDYLERLTWLVSLDYFLEEQLSLEIKNSQPQSLDYLAAHLLTANQYLITQSYRRFRYK